MAVGTVVMVSVAVRLLHIGLLSSKSQPCVRPTVHIFGLDDHLERELRSCSSRSLDSRFTANRTVEYTIQEPLIWEIT
jgi:hypothetical protein